MKKIKLNTTKLQLNKEKIASLSRSQMDGILGGAEGSTGYAPCTDLTKVGCPTNQCGTVGEGCGPNYTAGGYTICGCVQTMGCASAANCEGTYMCTAKGFPAC